jgi:N-acetylglucosaminyldiphosphoundecaprenol N-acetyl-beta-D-mannosaminyltransferase
MEEQMSRAGVLGVPLDALSLDQAVAQIIALTRDASGKYVCFVDAHMLVQAHDFVEIRRALEAASMRLADGTPVSWCLRLLHRGARCVRGPEALPALLDRAQEADLGVGFYGGSPETLERMTARVKNTYPRLRVEYSYSPPFRKLADEEQLAILEDIRKADVQLLFVGLGCPKQELWMYRHSAELPCISLGVGAAFRIFSGEIRLPPKWIMNTGFTWAVRLAQEPRRLFGRVFLYLPRFAVMVLVDAVAGLANQGKSWLFG